MQRHRHTLGSKVQTSNQNFHSWLKQKQSTKKPLSVTSEVFTSPKATLPTSVQVFASLMQCLWKASVQRQGCEQFWQMTLGMLPSYVCSWGSWFPERGQLCCSVLTVWKRQWQAYCSLNFWTNMPAHTGCELFKSVQVLPSFFMVFR